MHIFTSITNNYIPKARVLAKSIAKFCPDWKLHVILCDVLPSEIKADEEPFASIIEIDQLPLNKRQDFIFEHRVTEICTAVKGVAAVYLTHLHNLDKIMYLDPDIAVFGDLSPLDELLDEHPILLAPHQCKPETTPSAIFNNEIGSLRWGVFNLGFMACRTDGQGEKFMDWWASRLLNYCFDDIPTGLFTDQRWCDLAPIFFDQLYILRDPEYDVATWNLTQREIAANEAGEITVDGKPLKFYHFSGYDSGAGEGVRRYLFPDSNHLIHDLWEWYEAELQRHGQSELGDREWFFARFPNGAKIPNELRTLYRQRGDLKELFPDPYAYLAGEGLCRWALNEGYLGEVEKSPR